MAFSRYASAEAALRIVNRAELNLEDGERGLHRVKAFSLTRVPNQHIRYFFVSVTH